MALVKCLECNNNISTGALSCPHCGMVLKADNNIIYDKDKFFIVGSVLIKYLGGNADTVIIPEGIKSIGSINKSSSRSVASSCVDYGIDIKNIILPDSLEKIGDKALQGSTVVNLKIPRNVKQIGRDAFWNCKNLRKISFENQNTEIFQSESDVGIGDTIRLEKSNIFCGCDALEAVTGHQFAISQLNMYKVEKERKNSSGCYVATAVYGAYDCPQVWTLRRYRDDVLSATWYGRNFIRLYYAISPTVVKLFGHTKWFNKMWRSKLDHMVDNLQKRGFESTPYDDKNY